MLNNLRDLCMEIADNHGFTSAIPEDNPLCIPTLLSLIHSEVSEVLEEFRKGKSIDEELADIIIRVLDISGRFNIDIQKAVDEKIAKNMTRPFLHGNKRF